MQHDLSEIANPFEIAASLIREHGKGVAIKLAMGETLKAHSNNDNYSLSVWRDVKRILREKLSSQRLTKEV